MLMISVSFNDVLMDGLINDDVEVDADGVWIPLWLPVFVLRLGGDGKGIAGGENIICWCGWKCEWDPNWCGLWWGWCWWWCFDEEDWEVCGNDFGNRLVSLLAFDNLSFRAFNAICLKKWVTIK